MKKKTLAIVAVLALTLTLFGCSNNTKEKTSDSKAETQTAKTEETVKETDAPQETEADPTAPIKAECDEGVLEFLRYEVGEDYSGAPAIILYFNFTNKSENSAMTQTCFYPKVFQNGIECDMAMLMDNEAYSNLTKEIQTDITLEVAFAYELQDTTNPIDLEVTALSEMFSGNTYKQTINLQ